MKAIAEIAERIHFEDAVTKTHKYSDGNISTWYSPTRRLSHRIYGAIRIRGARERGNRENCCFLLFIFIYLDFFETAAS